MHKYPPLFVKPVYNQMFKFQHIGGSTGEPVAHYINRFSKDSIVLFIPFFTHTDTRHLVAASPSFLQRLLT